MLGLMIVMIIEVFIMKRWKILLSLIEAKKLGYPLSKLWARQGIHIFKLTLYKAFLLSWIEQLALANFSMVDDIVLLYFSIPWAPRLLIFRYYYLILSLDLSIWNSHAIFQIRRNQINVESCKFLGVNSFTWR